jgi:hypothetical protein
LGQTALNASCACSLPCALCLPACLQFRQAIFKLEFKARQQLPAQRGNGSAKKRNAAGASNEEARDQVNTIIAGDAAIRQQAMLHLRRLLIACSESDA